ncbi:LOG family protein [Alkalibacillus haloalkaliphilus]|uniref:Cytokinin riboside 5'-monophosphate phosphoribohydrolase n=1 Tax=Alkalibacillus haloalkaliphilus TaxID=94136 RepID=A0A511W4Q2_9BACI|nr:TIGR00730 family Rossman fold protein [Alkalibacillus haloalkaliphilus]GEN46055.1 cytokinin riboside 5'-monophosphate phosphoribohydrolase [Alkalibacillus haloalkaliphilus]
MKRVAVFCGSRKGRDPVYMKKAKQLGEVLAQHNIELVYGGAIVGCMGAVAEGVLKNGGKAIGVIPEKLKTIEIAHDALTELHVVETMHDRKAMMARLADAFIALPGGAGTLEEWFEVVTWAQIGYHEKPCALLNINDYYTPLLELFDHMIEQGFVDQLHKDLIIMDSDPHKLIHHMKEL